jgi:hypothetical protein
MSGRSNNLRSYSSNGVSRRVLVRFAAVAAVSMLAAACARTMPVYNVAEAPVVTASGNTPSAVQVRDAIITACRDKGWLVNPRADGHIIATAHVRRHTAVVDIHYSPARYAITYKDSEVLLYDGQQIHRNYNKWVQLLEERINFELQQL